MRILSRLTFLSAFKILLLLLHQLRPVEFTNILNINVDLVVLYPLADIGLEALLDDFLVILFSSSDLDINDYILLADLLDHKVADVDQVEDLGVLHVVEDCFSQLLEHAFQLFYVQNCEQSIAYALVALSTAEVGVAFGIYRAETHAGVGARIVFWLVATDGCSQIELVYALIICHEEVVVVYLEYAGLLAVFQFDSILFVFVIAESGVFLQFTQFEDLY